ncbi:hypothetical protein [Devosia sp. A449]
MDNEKNISSTAIPASRQCDLDFPKRASADETFAAMATAELRDAIYAILAVHHSFNQQGALYSGINTGWERMQSWCDAYCDQLQNELRLASDEYLSRPLTDPDDIETRSLALASAFSLVSGGGDGFTVSVTITPNGGA